MAFSKKNKNLSNLDNFCELYLDKLPEAQKLLDYSPTILPSEIRMILSALAAILLS